VFEFFATNTPDPLHWTKNSSFGVFRTFRYCTKVDAKLANVGPLTHKFAKRSGFEIFRNEYTRSPLLDPKLMFWVIWDRFVTVRKLRLNFSQQMHPIHSIRPKTHVLGCFGPFRYCTKMAAKLADHVPLTHKFTKRNCFKIFWNKRT
jgi:hypothetical protein